MSALTITETSKLKECERVIERGLATFYAVGNALMAIRDDRLYRVTHATFEEYCRERWGMSRFYAHRLIDSASVVSNLLPIGNIPATESQARELVSLEPYQQREVWQAVLETAPEGKITAAHIRTVVDQLNDVEKETVKAMSREITARRTEENAAIREEIKARPVIVPTGKYQCIVIDPPWPMEKIERDERPNQVGFDYPTMNEDELKAFPLPEFAADDCHLYLWTTHKFLPMALRLAEHWAFRYQCLMTWVKNVGMTPFSWMYSTEHVLFCRKGSLRLEKLGMRLDFNAKVREHSRKPDEFYELVRQASPAPRLDVFSREAREGFEQLGNEAEKFQEASA